MQTSSFSLLQLPPLEYKIPRYTLYLRLKDPPRGTGSIKRALDPQSTSRRVVQIFVGPLRDDHKMRPLSS